MKEEKNRKRKANYRSEKYNKTINKKSLNGLSNQVGMIYERIIELEGRLMQFI